MVCLTRGIVMSVDELNESHAGSASPHSVYDEIASPLVNVT